MADRDGRDDDLAAAGSHRDEAGVGAAAVAGDLGDRGRRRGAGGSRPGVAGTWCSPSRGRRCCARSGATTSGSSKTTGCGSRKYFAGDGAKKDDDGDIWLLGRVDDVMLVSGHNIDDRGRVGARLASFGRRGGGGRCGGPQTTGQAIVAFAICGTASAEDAGLVADLRNHVDDAGADRQAEAGCCRWPSCPRLGPGRSCGGCCATWRRTGSWGCHDVDGLHGDGSHPGEAAGGAERGLRVSPTTRPLGVWGPYAPPHPHLAPCGLPRALLGASARAPRAGIAPPDHPALVRPRGAWTRPRPGFPAARPPVPLPGAPRQHAAGLAGLVLGLDSREVSVESATTAPPPRRQSSSCRACPRASARPLTPLAHHMSVTRNISP